MTQLDDSIRSARGAPAPWDDRRADVVYGKVRTGRAARDSRRKLAIVALGLAASLAAWSFLGRSSAGADALGTAEVAGVSAPAPASWHGPAGSGDGGYETSVQ